MRKRPNDELLINELMIMEFEIGYPSLNVRQEIRSMQMWWRANPTRRKTNEFRFVVNWLNASFAKISRDAVASRRNSEVGKYRPEQQMGGQSFSADDREYYRQFWKQHPDLKPSWAKGAEWE